MNKNPLKFHTFKNNLELRMYGLVCYQLTGIQGGIQYGHSKDQYTAHIIEYIMNWHVDAKTRKQLYPDAETDESILENYLDWLANWKTYIILNGGTTNTHPERLGSLNQHLQTLQLNGVFCTEFYEPDLGDQLTGINFIVDERVFNKKKYPDYGYYYDTDGRLLPKTHTNMWKVVQTPGTLSLNGVELDPICYGPEYDAWIESLGGQKNVFLRKFLSNFRLA
jgi:hypothetical protein